MAAAGPVALADYPTVLLSGTWLSEEQVSAASEFARFMHKPEQLAELASAGFRAEGASPKGNDVVDFGPIGEPLAVGDEALRATLADARPRRRPARRPPSCSTRRCPVTRAASRGWPM